MLFQGNAFLFVISLQLLLMTQFMSARLFLTPIAARQRAFCQLKDQRGALMKLYYRVADHDTLYTTTTE